MNENSGYKQRDYWDARDIFIQLPLPGSKMRYLRSRLSAPKPDTVEKKEDL